MKTPPNRAGIEQPSRRKWDQVSERNESLDTLALSVWLWHKMRDRDLFSVLAHYLGHDKAKAEWDAAYPSGRRF